MARRVKGQPHSFRFLRPVMAMAGWDDCEKGRMRLQKMRRKIRVTARRGFNFIRVLWRVACALGSGGRLDVAGCTCHVDFRS